VVLVISAVQRLTTSFIASLARVGGRHWLASTRFLIAFAEGAHLLARQQHRFLMLQSGGLVLG